MTGEDPAVRKDSQSGRDPASVSDDKDSRGNDYVCIRLTSQAYTLANSFPAILCAKRVYGIVFKSLPILRQ
jgi:hypothetical protein